MRKTIIFLVMWIPLTTIGYAYASHIPFGIYAMAMPDAILWSFLGIVFGVILSFCYLKFRQWLDGE